MSREWKSYLDDMRVACEKIMQFTAGMNREAFFRDDRTYHAVIHCLLIIGEAAKCIPNEIRQNLPAIEWKKIAGMRDWMVHVYFSISENILWDVVETKIPELLREIQAFTERESS